MVKRRRAQKGQSILEYLVIATVIVGAILAIRGVVQTNMNDLYTEAAAKTADAATALEGLEVEVGEDDGSGPGPGPGPGL